MKKLRDAAAWMWDHRGQNIWWKPAVLTPANPDQTNPGLNLVEAESIFRLLEDARLIFPTKHPGDESTVYLINEVREKEWTSFLKDLSPFQRYVGRPMTVLFGYPWIVIVWFISLVIASGVGAFFGELMESFFKNP